MRRSRRVAGAAAAIGLLSACLGAGLFSEHGAAAQEDPASRALAYLQTQQGGDGSIAGPAGSYADSELFAIAAAAAGYDPNALTAASGTSVMAYLSANASGACTPSTPGACGELIEAVVAAGEDPAAFGGQDLVTALDAAHDPTTGEYGDGEAFTEALAIQGLVAAGAPVPVAAIHFLEAAQDSDGGWDYLDDRDDPNGATDYDLSDTNSTAMVLMALDAAGDHGRDASALAWLASQQDPDGGFPYQAGAGSDPDSTALVLQAIVATGGDPAASAWAQGGQTPVSYLVAAQDSDGGYTYPGDTGPDPFTTSQVTPALERLAFPVGFGTRSWYPPGATLGSSPAPSPSPTPAPPTPTGPPAGVIAPATPTPTEAPAPPVTAQVQAAATTATPRVAPSESTPSPAPASPGTSTSEAPRSGPAPAAPAPQGGPPALLIFALVALAAAVVVGGFRLIWARR